MTIACLSPLFFGSSNAARGLEKRKRKLDAEEFLEVIEMPFAEALAMVRDGRITDAKSVASLLWVKTWGG